MMRNNAMYWKSLRALNGNEMRRRALLCLLLCFVLMITGCGSDKANEETSAKDNKVEEEAEKGEALAAGAEVDIDLTTMSSTMVYSEVNNMVLTPEDFRGKTIRMRGAFAYYQDEESGKSYYGCIVKDATACCSQGLEFILAGDYSYPEDYPAVDTEITVVGRFEPYEENGGKYCHIVDAIMEWR